MEDMLRDEKEIRSIRIGRFIIILTNEKNHKPISCVSQWQRNCELELDINYYEFVTDINFLKTTFIIYFKHLFQEIFFISRIRKPYIQEIFLLTLHVVEHSVSYHHTIAYSYGNRCFSDDNQASIFVKLTVDHELIVSKGFFVCLHVCGFLFLFFVCLFVVVVFIPKLKENPTCETLLKLL